MEAKELAGNILLVDDQIGNLRLLAAILNAKNYKVIQATDGESAIKAVETELPDLVILDIKMPDLNGYEVCQRLKSNAKTKDIPIMFISVNHEVADKVKAFEVGGIDYITKPFKSEEILARINSQLTIKKQQKILQNEQALLKKKQKLLEQQQKKLLQEIKQRKETEEFLLQSIALTSSILINSLDAIAVLEAVRNIKTGKIQDFRCLVINSNMEQLFDKKPNELTGKWLLKKNLNKLNPNLFDSCVEIVETGVSLEKNFRYKYKEEQKWYHVIAVKLSDGLCIKVKDITEKKKLGRC